MSSDIGIRAVRGKREAGDAKLFGVGYKPWEDKYFGNTRGTPLSLAWSDIQLYMRNKVVISLIMLRLFIWTINIMSATLFSDIGVTQALNLGIWGNSYFTKYDDVSSPIVPFEEVFFYSVGSLFGILDILLATIVGSSMISNDKIWGTLSLYFSRIGKLGYLSTKFFTLSAFMVTFTWIPIILKYTIIHLARGSKWTEWFTESWTLLIALLYGAFVMIFLASLILSLSASVEKGLYLTIILVMLSAISWVVTPIFLLLRVRYTYFLGGFQEHLRVIFGAMLGLDMEDYYATFAGFDGEGVFFSGYIIWLSALIIASITLISLANLMYQINKIEVS